MFKNLYIHELQNYLYSLRFQISFIIVILVFAFGTVSYIVSLSQTQENYNKLVQKQQQQLEERSSSLSEVAVDNFSTYILSPKSYYIIDDCKENVLPSHFEYNAFNVYSFNLSGSNNNVLMKKAQGLNWSFIMSMILSFITLLLAFDAISGEKEDRTLSLVFSNKVSRGSFIFSKFLSTVTAIFCITLVGVMLSLLIIMLSGKIQINNDFLFNTLCFLAVSLLFISIMAITGLLASALTKQSNVSLLTCLTVWIFLAVVLPNSSLFFANKLFAIPSLYEVNLTINQEQNSLRENAPDGSMSYMGNDPFYPKHELRANLQMSVMLAEKRHKDAYYNQMFNQFENTRKLSILSPIAQFEYLNEGMLGGGYLRFNKNWNDLHIFQESFLNWFKDIDSKDDKSPHWYNPYEGIATSALPVSVDQIPVYIEKPATFAERLSYIRVYLLVMLALFAIIFSICFVRFLRYDVR